MEQSGIQPVIDECMTHLRTFANGRYAISVAGSHGKGTSDHKSDIDFRLFCDEIADGPEFWKTQKWKNYCSLVEKWRHKGIDIDYCWIRTVSEIDEKLNTWLDGQPVTENLVWTIWGYHLPTDLCNQQIIHDPHGIIANWQAKLDPYPAKLQKTIIHRHLESLNYWRADYHYRNKVARRDIVFLAGITTRLVHDMIQLLFAINKTHYAGDGNNLHFVTSFPVKPRHFIERVESALYPPHTPNTFQKQYETIISLIDDIAPLAEQAYGGKIETCDYCGTE